MEHTKCPENIREWIANIDAREQDQIDRLTKQRDELVKAIKEALESGEDGDWQSARRVMKAALTSVKGGA